MSVLLCPLCSQPRFNTLESLRLSLIKAATQNISCPICCEVLVGLDKLTIHLFGHSIGHSADDSINLDAAHVQVAAPKDWSLPPGEGNHFLVDVRKSEEQVVNARECRTPEKSIYEPDRKTDSINLEDLGFLTSLEDCLRGDGGIDILDEKTAETGSREDTVELSEYMSDLLSKKLPVVNFVVDPLPEKGQAENPMERNCEKCTNCDSELQNPGLSAFDVEGNHANLDNRDDEARSAEDPRLITSQDLPDGNPFKNLVLPRYHCHLCQKSFKMKGNLLVHYKMTHLGLNSAPGSTSPLRGQESTEERNFHCSICNKSFKKDQHLTQHIKTHEGKQWKCETCSKSFTTKYFLKKHQRLHTGEMPYSCPTCNKTFTFQQSYHKHLLYHSNEKPHKCAQCGRAFKELSTLHNHQRIHSGEKPFACETCGKCFRQKVSYVIHQRIHTGALPYQCTGCHKKFRYKMSQRSHKCTAQPPGTVVRISNNVIPQGTTSSTYDPFLCAQQDKKV